MLVFLFGGSGLRCVEFNVQRFRPPFPELGLGLSFGRVGFRVSGKALITAPYKAECSQFPRMFWVVLLWHFE